MQYALSLLVAISRNRDAVFIERICLMNLSESYLRFYLIKSLIMKTNNIIIHWLSSLSTRYQASDFRPTECGKNQIIK